MLFVVLLKSIFLGVIVAAPVGPVGALVIRRTLKVGMGLGLWTGMGAAIADASFAFGAIFGIAQVQMFLDRNDRVIAFGGGILLLALGSWYLVRDLRKKNRARELMDNLPPDWLEHERAERKAQQGTVSNYIRACLGSLVITLSNPVTIVGFAGAFAAFGILGNSDVTAMTHGVVVLGVLLGSFLWWLSLALLVRWMRGRLSNVAILNIQLITHGLILFSGLLCLGRGILKS